MVTVGAGAMPLSILSATRCSTTDSDILGPYWVDNPPERTVLANYDEPGTRIFVSGIIYANDCVTPVKNAVVEIWHANDDGCYTVYQECPSGNTENDSFNLRGIIITNDYGYYGFESIMPGHYEDRPKHFHFKVITPSGSELVTQCYFDSDPRVDEQWRENHPTQVISNTHTENGLTGTFNIFLNEAASDLETTEDLNVLSKGFSLKSIYPNPFNGTGNIKFFIQDKGYVDISIYNINGKWISTLIQKSLSSGDHNVIWHGTDFLGNPVSSGSYIVVMKYFNSFKTEKIIFSK